MLLASLIARGHVLIEDYPGLGKTVTARAFAQVLGLPFTRAQFTPDLLPSDLTGSYVYDPAEGRFNFRPGPVFTGLLLADEINRTPPKTQAALLEAMQEGQATVEGTTHPLPRPFHVIATANPVEHEGTYPLPEAQLDRFLLRLSFGYPSLDDECRVLTSRMTRGGEETALRTVASPETLLALQECAESVYVHPDIVRYLVQLCAASREHRQVLLGASPRGSLALLTTARAWALMQGRDFVLPSDVQELAPAALAHRIAIKPELWLQEVQPGDVVSDLLRSVPVPDIDPAAR
ncbi:MoxR family ATPase [Dermabacteraceae bacterium TAE3-ERU27]|nr:MoxR family ATPase [Dermabacteraceae bacterium TAE3-ERU27]